jgi:ATP-dependent protease ClpP protease subunit|nr:MAG TPA: Putative ATP dependent Clp protease [Caudoviricetes sp.]
MMPKTIDIKGPIITNDDKWIYDWFGVASCCPADIRSQLDDVTDDESVQVVINSSGGDIFAASEIYDMLAESNATIKVIFAASAASYIACACTSEIVPTGMLMIHNVSSYAAGDYNDMAHESDVLLKASKAVATAYQLKTGMSENELIGLMDKETWFTADEAVKKGFIDKVTEYAEKPKEVKLAASLNGLIPDTIIKQMRDEKTQLTAKLELLKRKEVEEE